MESFWWEKDENDDDLGGGNQIEEKNNMESVAFETKILQNEENQNKKKNLTLKEEIHNIQITMDE